MLELLYLMSVGWLYTTPGFNKTDSNLTPLMLEPLELALQTPHKKIYDPEWFGDFGF